MLRNVYVILGHLCVVLGVVGLFLPVMPTVVFLIAAAACYARGNPALKRKLLAHPKLGPPLRLWEEHHAISLRGKVAGIAMVTVGIGCSVIFLLEATWLRAVLLVIGGGIVGFLLALETRG